MLNKILRIIVGLPFVTIWWVFMCILGTIFGCGVVVYEWVNGDLDLDWLWRRYIDCLPRSPYQFVKEVWKGHR